MPDHVFVDEVKRSGYVVAVAAVTTTDLEATRCGLRRLLLQGQSALHFTDEQEGRRRHLLARMATMPITAQVYVRHGDHPVTGRRRCLDAVVEDLAARGGVERLVLELSDGDLAADRRTLYVAGRKHSIGFTYHHLRAPQEPGLWAADGIAWAWTHAGPWRAMVAGIVTEVVEV